MRPTSARRLAVAAALALATVAVVAAPAALAVPVVPASAAADRPAAQAATPQQHEGEIFSFGITVPAEPIIVGDSIVFPNNSDRPHTITDRGGTFDSDEIAPGTSGEVTFEVPGRYEIFCRINPSTMNALVDVAPGDDPPAATRVQLYDEVREGETRRFDPVDLEIDEGTAITVANVGGLEHTFTAEDGSFDTGTVAPGAEQGTFAGTSAELVAEKPGDFVVFCEFFPDEMRGTLRVVAEEPPATTTTEAVPDEAAAEEVPPDDGDADEAAAPPPVDDDDGGGLVAAIVVVVLGLLAIALALVPRGGSRRPAAPQAF